MKKLTTLFDSKLKKDYDLYQVNAKELVKVIQSAYEKEGLTQLFVQRFNGELESNQMRTRYIERLTDINAIKAGIKRDPSNDYHSLQIYEKEVKDFEESFLNGKVIGEKEENAGALGYEMMPFALSVPNRDIENNLGKLELLDGFRRVFFMTNIPNEEVLVKVYDTLNDKEWISSMIVFNSWKFAQTKNLHFLDRGFKLGLYKRYDLDITHLYGYRHDTFEKSQNRYIQAQPFETLWENDQYVHDIRFIQQVKLHRPVFTLKKRKKEEIIDLKEDMFAYPSFLEQINQHIYSELGKLRRRETEKILNGENIKRKEMNFEDYVEFLQQPDLQEHFIKLYHMKVDGFIENSVNKNLSHLIRLIVDPSLAVVSK